MADKFTMRYRLSRTIVKIDGSVLIDTSSDGIPRYTRTSTVALGVEADPSTDATRDVEVDGDYFKSRDFSLTLAADGRLSGAGDTSSGVGGQVLSSIVSVGTTIAGVLAKTVPLFALVAQPEGEGEGGIDLLAELRKTVDEQYAEADPEAAGRRKLLAAEVDSLQAALVSLFDGLAQDPSEAAGKRLAVLQSALAAARAEAATQEALFVTWKAAAHPPWTQTFSYQLGTDQLSNIDDAPEERSFDDLGPSQRRIADTLGTVVARVRDRDPNRHTAADRSDAIAYRVPRRVELAVYQRREEGDHVYTLHSVMPAWIVDGWSITDIVPLHCGLFEKRSMKIELGDAGTLKQLSNSNTPPVAGIASALSGLGPTATTALEDAKKIGEAFPGPGDPSLKALENQVTRRELEARLANAAKTIGGNGQ